MPSTTADRVTLILDCLGHDDTELSGQPRLWRHRDGRYLTEEEAAVIDKECTVGDLRRAMDLWHEEIKQHEEHNQLRAEFLAIVLPYRADPAEPAMTTIDRLPEAELKRAADLAADWAVIRGLAARPVLTQSRTAVRSHRPDGRHSHPEG